MKELYKEFNSDVTPEYYEPIKEKCPVCFSKGKIYVWIPWVEMFQMHKCKMCNGVGVVYKYDETIDIKETDEYKKALLRNEYLAWRGELLNMRIRTRELRESIFGPTQGMNYEKARALYLYDKIKEYEGKNQCSYKYVNKGRV